MGFANNWNLFIVWSLVSFCVDGRSRDFKFAPTFRSVDEPQDSGFRYRDVRSSTVAREQNPEFPELGSPFSIPQGIKQSSLVAEKHPLATVPRDAEEFVTDNRDTPAPQSGLTPLPDVSVTCSIANLTVRVRKSFYGFSATSAELTLGRTCKSNGVHEPSGDLLFTYPLTSCDGMPEVQPDHVLYTFVLHYVPLPTHLPVLRARGVNVDIHCHFKSSPHVHKLVVRPTWVAPTSKTLNGNVPGFGIRTMNAAWTAPSPSNVFVLGQRVNFQAFARYLQPGQKLFIDYCYASISKDPNVTPRVVIIDSLGCMVDSKRDDSSAEFVPPRTDETINFVFDAFQFVIEPTAEVFLHCKLFVMSGDPSPVAKSCTYSKEHGRWRALSGKDYICDCCDSKCVTPKARRSMYEDLQTNGPLMFSSQDPRTKADTSTINFNNTKAIWPEAKTDRQEDVLRGYQDPVWQEDHDYMYGKEDRSHTHPPVKVSEGNEPARDKPWSTNRKAEMGAGEETPEEDHLHYGLASGTGIAKFMTDYNMMTGGHWWG